MTFTKKKVEKWLLTIGKKFGITKVYDSCCCGESSNKPNEYFTYKVISSKQMTYPHNQSTGNNVYIVVNVWTTTVLVSCYSKNGLYIMQCLHSLRPKFTIEGSLEGQNNTAEIAKIEIGESGEYYSEFIFRNNVKSEANISQL